MPHLRISEAARLVGVSDDTLRRWIDAERIETQIDGAGRQIVNGVDVAAFAARDKPVVDPTGVRRSARNRFTGIVTAISIDSVMAQVDLQCGPHRVVSLMSAEAVRDLNLELGSVATAVIKSTMVIVEVPEGEG
jgi:molybdopterin-binding protein